MRQTPTLSRWPRALALVAMLLCAAGSTRAGSGEATDAAFGALLAMPGAQPKEGGWHIPVPAAPDEAALIEQWRQLKKDGANFNAMRHRGTLLAHAIRAGKDRAAIWLLHNGADTRHVLFGAQEDAYGLALQFERVDVAKVLERAYGFKPRKPAPPAPVKTPIAAAPASSTLPSSQQAAIARMAALLGPGYPSAENQQAWRQFAATLSQDDYLALFKDGERIGELVALTRGSPDSLDEALSRLPPALVRQKAQQIAALLAEWSFPVHYAHPQEPYTGASLSWPALWKRLDQPLNYDKARDLAGRLPPTLWPALFASGYAEHDAQVTGCVLAEADLPAFKALWPDFQRFFVDAREAAPALVLARYRLDWDDAPCRGTSDPAQTVAKLAFLQAQGVTGPVPGLRSSVLEEAGDPALVAMAEGLAPRTPAEPRLVQVPPACDFTIAATLLDAFINAHAVGWGVPARQVHAIDVPGHERCGWVVSGDAYDSSPTEDDDFFNGPFREGSTRCGDLADDLDIWVEEAGRIVVLDNKATSRGSLGVFLRPVRDRKTGKLYLLNDGRGGAQCSARYSLPGVFEWQIAPEGPILRRSPDDALVEDLLRAQCEQDDPKDGVACRGIEPVGVQEESSDAEPQRVLATLHKGGLVTLEHLVDSFGRERRASYAAAIAAHDHAGNRRLVAEGIPARWTADEVLALEKADLPLEEKRRRVALLFANPGQLERALYVNWNGARTSLVSWLPDPDWGPVLRIVERSPDLWRDAANDLRNASVEAHRDDLACAIDHAQGYLCGGWIDTE